MGPAEQLWLSINAPTARIEVREIKNPERFKRYNTGQWDGKVVFVVFETAREHSWFKGQFWNSRI